MKIDKDALLKHRFWILVGLSVPFAAVAILLLLTSVSSSIESIRKGLKTVFDGVKNVKDVHTAVEIDEKKAAADILLTEETKAWGEAFRQQEVFFRWPRKMEATFHFADGLFANEVQVLKQVDKAEWPENKPGMLVHGTLKSITDSEFVIDAYDPKTKKASVERFFVTPTLLTKKGAVTAKDAEDPSKAALEYKDLQGFVGKLLAVGCQRARYFNDRLTFNEQSMYQKTYHSQIPPILRQVDPLRIEMDGKTPVVAGVVQLRSSTGWTFNVSEDKDYDEIPADKREALIPPEGSKFLRFVARDWDIKSDISDEAWIAQEDLWIQNEIYRVIRAANDSVSNYTDISGKATKAGDVVHYRNPYFDISLRLPKDSKTLDIRIANRLNRRQKIDGMKLRVRLSADPKAEPDLITISGDLLEAYRFTKDDDSKRRDVFLKSVPLQLKANAKRDHVYGLEQVLTWDLAAVKRIDHIAIGSAAADDTSFSHRTYPMGLQPLVKLEKKDEVGEKTGGPTGGGPAGGGSAPGALGAFGGKGGGVGIAGGGNAAGAALANGLVPDRYQEVTPQFRRIPLAIALIVDQNHVDRVQTAFNNSKLRILVTQVLLNHYPNSLKPQLPGDKDGADDKKGGGFGPPGFGPASNGPGPAGFPGGGKFGGQGQGGGAPVASVDDLEANMELVIYGVVTLYERYPSRSGLAAEQKP